MLSQIYLEQIWQGYKVTVALSLTACLAATLMGLILCFMRISNFAPSRWFAKSYINIFRNTPLLVQLFFWYFVVSSFIPFEIKNWLMSSHEWLLGPITLPWPSYEFIFGFIGLSFYTAAYIAEEVRAGIATVSTNQRDAALALGFKPHQAFINIILPQALRNAQSPLFSQYMMALKNSTLASAIGVAELIYVGAQIETQSLQAFAVYFCATILYISSILAIEAYLYLSQRRYAKRVGVKKAA